MDFPPAQDEKYLSGLNYAKSLNFTESQYAEAFKMVNSPDNANQLLLALLDVSSRSSGISGNLSAKQSNQDSDAPDGSKSTSCYSSITSFPSAISNHSSTDSLQLRTIYVDGSNVARTHGKNFAFSWLGIKLCVDWFLSRKHRVKVFLPEEKCSMLSCPEEASIVDYLYPYLTKTPNGCNDDFFIIEAAKSSNGVILSNDQFRDEKRFNNEFDAFIKSNRLPYVFDDNTFIPASDPLGRWGPTIDEFLREQPYNSQHIKLSRTKSNQSRYQRYSHSYVQDNQQRHNNQSNGKQLNRRSVSVYVNGTSSSSNGNQPITNHSSVVRTSSNNGNLNANNRKALRRTESHHV